MKIFFEKTDVRAGCIYHHGVYVDISEMRKKLFKYAKKLQKHSIGVPLLFLHIAVNDFLNFFILIPMHCKAE